MAGRNLVPMTDNESDLGSPTKRWKDVYVTNIVGYYNKGNVVGTVSQSGGVPTGAVIESGSNSNGSYIKFADGTLICYSPDLIVDSTIAIGSMFRSDSGYWTFPLEFANTSYSMSSCNIGNEQTHWGVCRPNSTTSCIYSVFSPTSATGRPIRITVIGRWF